MTAGSTGQRVSGPAQAERNTAPIDVNLGADIAIDTRPDSDLLRDCRRYARYRGLTDASSLATLNLCARYEALKAERDDWRRMCLDIDKRQDEPRVKHSTQVEEKG